MLCYTPIAKDRDWMPHRYYHALTSVVIDLEESVQYGTFTDHTSNVYSSQPHQIRTRISQDQLLPGDSCLSGRHRVVRNPTVTQQVMLG